MKKALWITFILILLSLTPLHTAVATEISYGYSAYYDYHFDPADQRPTALVLGNERAGVDPEVLAVCDSIVALPMLGEKRSLNVAVAFGSAGYWLTFGHDLHQAL